MKTIAEYKSEDILKHLHGGVLEKVFWNIQGQIDNAKEFLETEKNLDEELKQLTEKTIEEQEKIAKDLLEYHASYFAQSKEMAEKKNIMTTRFLKKNLQCLKNLKSI
jgi:hypothetical protein